MSAQQFIHDPQAVLDYSINWTSDLASGDTISASTWSVAPDDATLVVDSNSFTDTATTVWLSGGTGNTQYKVTNHITTAGGREDDQTIYVMVWSV